MTCGSKRGKRSVPFRLIAFRSFHGGTLASPPCARQTHPNEFVFMKAAANWILIAGLALAAACARPPSEEQIAAAIEVEARRQLNAKDNESVAVVSYRIRRSTIEKVAKGQQYHYFFEAEVRYLTLRDVKMGVSVPVNRKLTGEVVLGER